MFATGGGRAGGVRTLLQPARAQCLRLSEQTTKCGAGRICGADLNGDNLRISTAYLRISDHGLGSGLALGFGSGLGSGSGLELRLGLGFGLQIVVYKLLEKATKCRAIT